MTLIPKDISAYRTTGRLTDALPFPSDTTPDMYLGFANSDLRRPYKRNRVNAVTNAKRGLHLQIDVLTEALGIAKLPGRLRRFFPRKLEFLSKCGIVSPPILTKLNRLRNEVEHDYIVPSLDDARDFLDVVELFLAATSHCCSAFPLQSHFALKRRTSKGSNDPKSLAVRIYPNLGEIRVLGFYSDSRESLGVMTEKESTAWEQGEVLSILEDSEFYEWIELLLTKG